MTVSVATVSSDLLDAIPVPSATEALTGKMAGVQITTTEGSPDAEMKIRVRGGGSITGDNTPLFSVDGFPVESISDIPASDIEDITVLKDASSTAIYGSRGANGVILITTKRGKTGALTLNYSGSVTFESLVDKSPAMSASDYITWRRWAYYNSNPSSNPIVCSSIEASSCLRQLLFHWQIPIFLRYLMLQFPFHWFGFSQHFLHRKGKSYHRRTRQYKVLSLRLLRLIPVVL